MEEYCNYCQAEVDAWDEGDGVWSCPSCLNILFTTSLDDKGEDYLEAVDSSTYDSYTPDTGKDMWGRDKSSTWSTGYTPWWQKQQSSVYAGGQTSLSSGWGGGYSSVGGYGWSADRTKTYRMMKNKNHLDGLAKIVDPTIRHSLDYSTRQQSYCDMENNSIKVDGSMILDNDDKLDVVAGLAIHEKLHLVHSKPLMKYLRDKKYGIIDEHGSFGFDIYKSICNLVEDEYIEKQLPKTCPGYVSYISAVKDHYWKKVEDKLQDNDEPFADLMGAILLFVRYPSSLSAPQKKRWANDLKIVEKILKTDGIDKEGRFTAMENLWKHMMKRAKQLGYDKDEGFEGMYGEAIDGECERYEERCKEGGYEGEELEDIMKKHRKEVEKDYKRDYDSKCKTAIAKAMDAIGEEMRKIIAQMTGEQKKGVITKAMEDSIKELMEKDYEEHHLKSADAFNSRQTKVTWQKVSPTSSHRELYTSDKRAMKSVIAKLKRKIQLYGNPVALTIPNQKKGRLNKRQLHKIPQDRNDLFKIKIVQDDKQLDVCLLVDESGSMGHHYMGPARQSCIAVKEALQGNDKLNLWVFGHTADQNERGATEMYEYASPFMKDRPLACGAMRARYENRDGTAILSSAERVKAQSDHPWADKLMIIFSDGAPSADGYRGHSAHQHTAKMVKKVEGMGFAVIQVGFGGWASSQQGDMFTNHISVNDINTLPISIGKILKKVLRI
jgi:hypothetical protein